METMLQALKNSFYGPKPWKSKKIRLIGSRLNREELRIIISSLKKYDTVKSLEICLCEVDEDGLVELAKGMSEYSLILLQLVHVGVGNRAATAIATAVQECRLKKLDLSFNRIQELGAKAIASALQDCGLEMLLLGRNEIGPEGARAIADALTHSSLLKTLDLRLNQIGDEGTIALSHALTRTSLTTLQLDSNNITVESIKVLCKCLKESELQMLYLGSNGLENDSILMLLDALNQTQLKKLSINGNLFDDECIIRASEVLPFNYKLKELDLRQNSKISENSMDVLLKSLKSHVSLSKIYLSDTSVSREIQEAISNRLRCQQTERAKIMTILLSARVVPRIGMNSKLSSCPIDILRLVSGFLSDSQILE